MKTPEGLTLQQEAAVRALVEGRTQADAYRHAYPRSRQWKAKTVHEQASALFAEPKIAARVNALQAAAAEKAAVKAGEILTEALRLAKSDIANIMNADGTVKLPHELDAATRAAVASFEIDDLGKIKYRFWDKNQALEKLFKHLGLYEKDNAQQNPLADLWKQVSGQGSVVRPSPAAAHPDDPDDPDDGEP